MSTPLKFKFTEYLDLGAGESLTIKLHKCERGFYEFAIDGDIKKGTKTVEGLRLFYKKPAGQPGVDYYDIGQQTLLAQLLPVVEAWCRSQRTVKITAFGAGKQKRFTVDAL